MIHVKLKDTNVARTQYVAISGSGFIWDSGDIAFRSTVLAAQVTATGRLMPGLSNPGEVTILAEPIPAVDVPSWHAGFGARDLKLPDRICFVGMLLLKTISLEVPETCR